MYKGPRSGNILFGVVHVPPGPETHTGAEDLVNNVLNTNGSDGGGYHSVSDDNSTVIAAQDNELVYGAGGVNEHALHSCLMGQADQTAQQWLDPYSRLTMKQSATWMAGKCKAYHLPVRHLTPQQIANHEPGLCGHVDVNMSGLPGTVWPGGHYDPGPNFPWSAYLKLVDAAINGHTDVEVDYMDLASAFNKGGSPEIFKVGKDKKLYNQWREGVGKWSDWNDLSDGLKDFEAVTAFKNNDGEILIVVIMENGATFRRWHAAKGWSGWVPA